MSHDHDSGSTELREHGRDRFLFDMGDGAGRTFASENESNRRKRTERVHNGQKFLQVLSEGLSQIEIRLSAIEARLAQLQAVPSDEMLEKEFYTTAETAELLGKRPYTVREWCRLARINAERAEAERQLAE